MTTRIVCTLVLFIRQLHVTVRQRRHAIFQDVTFVVVRAQSDFTVLDGFDLVRARAKQSIFGMFDISVPLRSQIHLVSHVLGDEYLFDAFGRPLCHSFFVVRRLYILDRRPTNSNGGLPLHSSFILPMTFMFTAEYRV